MYCRVCDIEYPKALRFCKWCGGGLVDKDAVGKQHCPACGSSVNKEWLFCNECGVDLASLGAQPKDQTCPSCSAAVRKGWMFCRQCGEQIATERAEASCDVCGAGLREGWNFCKQCGAPAAGTAESSATPPGDSFATVVGIPAVGQDTEVTEPFSGLASGELPMLDDVIENEKRRKAPPLARPAPPPPSDAQGQGGTRSLNFNRATAPLDERALEREYANHPLPGSRQSSDSGGPPSHTIAMSALSDAPAGFGTETDSPSGPAPMPPAHDNSTIAMSAVSDPPAGFGAESDSSDNLRTVAIPAVVLPPPPVADPTVTLPSGGSSPIASPDATVAVPVAPPPQPPPAPDATVAVPMPPQGSYGEVVTPQPHRGPSDFAPPAPRDAQPGSSGSALKWVTMAVAAIALLAVVVVAALYFLRGEAQPVEPIAQQPAPSLPVPAPQPAPVEQPPAMPVGMVLVEAGTYTVGSDSAADEFSRPAHQVDLGAFYIDRTEVTNADYKKFVDATGRTAPKSWENGAPAPGTENLPVVYVTYADAEAYAKWAGKRLPTEAEWEAAARGKDGRRYPWGNAWDPSMGNIGRPKGQGKIEPVGTYPAGASPSGALDMIGNVWEWTSSRASVYPGGTAALAEHAGKMVMRGSTFEATPAQDATWRGFYAPDQDGDRLGFRCVKDVN